MTAANVNMAGSVEAATRIAGARNPTRIAISLSTDDTINMACAVVALDVTAGLAGDLLKALEEIPDADLPPGVTTAVRHLTNALVAIGYATLQTEEKTHGNDD